MKQNRVHQFTNRRGLSLIIVLIFMNIITLIVLDMFSYTSRLVRTLTNSRADGKGVFAFDMGLRAGKAAAVQLPAGREVGLKYVCSANGTEFLTGDGPAPLTTPPCNQNRAEFSVTSRAVDIDPSAASRRFIVPPPGEGNAGENCVRPNNYANPAHSANQNILKPCNWNRLYFGESVAIPLYVTNEPNPPWNPSGVINPVDLPDGPPGLGEGLDEFTIKVRTPCSGGISYTNGNLAAPGVNDEGWCLDADTSTTGAGAREELEDGNSSLIFFGFFLFDFYV